MEVILFSTNSEILKLWEQNLSKHRLTEVYSLDELKKYLNDNDKIVIVDYDSVASNFNKLISSNKVPKNTAVLEQLPNIPTGKMLISHGIKGYGNSAMLDIHLNQMIETIKDNNIWTFPELTASLAKTPNAINLSKEAKELINAKLSQKEKEILYLVLEGFTNDTIAQKIGISTRTVKAHISSIFEKLHVNDRLSLALLLLNS
jgi:DNA-binding NarL/FixJ family response regulator